MRTAVVVFEIDVGDFAADTRQRRFFGLGAADDFVLFVVLVCGVSVVVIAVSVVVGECGGRKCPSVRLRRRSREGV